MIPAQPARPTTSTHCRRPGPRVLGALAAGALAVLAGPAGCLLPADSDYVPDENVPPRIVDPSPSPADGLVVQGPACADASYTVLVVDPDPGETIYWRVFVDYQTKSGRELKEGRATNESPGVPIGPFTTGQDTPWVGGEQVPHVVELVVSDREFYADDRTPRGHAVPPEAETDSIFWTVQYTLSPLCTP